MDHANLNRIGAAVRRVPGGGVVLDSRLAWRRGRERRAAARREAGLQERDRRWVAELRGRSDLKINVGSSSSRVEGWINSDVERDPEGRCLRFDATERWPFDDASALAVNSEHVIEHLYPAEAPLFFAEAFRVLAPGGVIRTSTPDLEWLCRAYLEADPEVLAAHRRHHYTASDHADLVNNYVYMHDHRHVYDLATLERLLRTAGFRRIERARFGHSRHHVLVGVDTHDLDVLDDMTLIVDAEKPGA